jgi:predicted O-methyltransferase YrrM
MNIDSGLTMEQLKAKWQSLFEQTRAISALTEDHTMAYLAEQAQDKVVLEIGTYHGASAFMMLSAGARVVHCVDPFMELGSEEVTRKWLRPWLDAHRAVIWTVRSALACKKLAEIKIEFDVIFVDDGHWQHEVEYDIDSSYPLLRSGGLICGHDLDKGGDVERAVKNKLPDFQEPVPRLWAHIKP